MTEAYGREFVSRALERSASSSAGELINYLKQELQDLSLEQKQQCLYSLLEPMKLSLAGEEVNSANRVRFEQVEAVLDFCAANDPTDSFASIMLAEHFLYYDIDPIKAGAVAEIAERKALAESAFIRQALGVKIRAAIARGDFQTVEAALETLVRNAGSSTGPDVAPERDFLERIPSSAVRPEVLRAYQTLLD